MEFTPIDPRENAVMAASCQTDGRCAVLSGVHPADKHNRQSTDICFEVHRNA